MAVSFLTAKHSCPLASAKLYCSMMSRRAVPKLSVELDWHAGWFGWFGSGLGPKFLSSLCWVGSWVWTCIESRQANSFCSWVHNSYGRPIVVWYIGVQLNIWVGLDIGSIRSPGSGLGWVRSVIWWDGFGWVEKKRPWTSVGCTSPTARVWLVTCWSRVQHPSRLHYGAMQNSTVTLVISQCFS